MMYTHVYAALFTKRGNRHISSNRILQRVELSAATKRAQPTQIRSSFKRSSSSAFRAEMASGWLHSTGPVASSGTRTQGGARPPSRKGGKEPGVWSRPRSFGPDPELRVVCRRVSWHRRDCGLSGLHQI